MKKILILSANPKDTSKLRLDEEVQEIEAGLERCKYRSEFEIISKWAVRPDTLRQAMLDHEPEIVHFCGHGAGVDGLALENKLGEMQLVSTNSLGGLFKLFEGKIKCVVLNACYSEAQSEAIKQHVDWVVGMNQAIGDKAAVQFAKGFYDALGAGRSYEDAFAFGCNAIDLEEIPEVSTPVMKSKNSGSQTIIPVQEPKEAPVINRGNLSSEVRAQFSVSKPLKTSAIENPEGQVPLKSSFYIERPPHEVDCYETILQPAALIRVKAPRQMGKTSLMTRILHHAQQHDYKTVRLNFQSADGELLDTLDEFLQWFCASVAFELDLPDKLDSYWKGILGSKNKCTRYFERYLLPQINSPIVLGLDEVDQVFKYPEIAADFFGLLRAWHERAKNDEEWQKLALVIVHSKEVYIPLHINQSPFNVGLAVELPDLNEVQMQHLIQLHGLNLTGKEVEQIMNLVGGHPYLLRVALYQIARGRITLEKLWEIAPTEEGLYSEHLRRHLLNLQEDEQLLTAFKQVLAASKPVDVGTTAAFKLRSMGLVKLQGNSVAPKCDLYRKYFSARLEVV